MDIPDLVSPDPRIRLLSWGRRVLRSPLAHFLVLGSGLYAIQHALFPAPTEHRQPVVLDAGRIDAASRDWERTTGRAATAAVRERLSENLIEEELLFREALALGLHRTDAIAVRRLIQNQRFLSSASDEEQRSDGALLREALALGLEKTDLVVRRRLIEHMRSLQSQQQTAPSDGAATDPSPIAGRVRLSHVFQSRQQRGTEVSSDAQHLRERILAAAWSPADVRARDLGDPLLIPAELPPSTARRLASRFGPEFAAAVFALEPGEWSQPIASSYGLHLVWVHEQASGSEARHDAPLAPRTGAP